MPDLSLPMGQKQYSDLLAERCLHLRSSKPKKTEPNHTFDRNCWLDVQEQKSS